MALPTLVGWEALQASNDNDNVDLKGAKPSDMKKSPDLTDPETGDANTCGGYVDCVMACGTEAPNPAELLGSEAFSRFLTAMLAKFDTVIVDTPPLGAGVDAYVLGAATGNMLLVRLSNLANEYVIADALRIERRHGVTRLRQVIAGFVGGQKALGKGPYAW